MKKQKTDNSFIPVPGELIKLIMDKYAVSKSVAAKTCRLSAEAFDSVLEGESIITKKVAKGLGRILGTGEQVWVDVQNTYDELVSSLPAVPNENEQNDQTARIHTPGDTLMKVLESKCISANTFAVMTGLPIGRITSILSGDCAITEDDAYAFERALDVTSIYWLGIQQEYEDKLKELND